MGVSIGFLSAEPGTFTSWGIGGLDCTECPIGAECLGDLHRPYPKPNYWLYNYSILSSQQKFVFECGSEGACLGGEQNSCSSAYTGRLCNMCNNGHFRSTHTHTHSTHTRSTHIQSTHKQSTHTKHTQIHKHTQHTQGTHTQSTHKAHTRHTQRTYIHTKHTQHTQSQSHLITLSHP